ncbi:MAG: M15 family metallopeptidase [Oscillibacter sp.]|jgi:D-alanyl-D-alanine dipeptidase/carboxypeptidase|nr:D-alanyl-D-alanine carboxypeptidase family protein [uncultured Oscillibacter sp.]MCI9644910.1 M15 family metallopeptidase [Oscillibacter sp.]
MRTVTLQREQAARGPLILVNPAHPLLPGPAPELTAPDSRFPGILLERRTAGLLAACVRAAGGGRDIVPVSGWRSQAEQQAIWDDTWASQGEGFTRRYVALPGCSEHQTGLAIDLGKRAERMDFIRPDFPDEGPCGAFRRLAARYGFILRYRREKEDVTGIGEEPWHFRYVGAPHAALIEEHGLCLEEYGDFLRAGPQRRVLSNGRRVEVSWLACPGESVEAELPEGICQLSGDNGGGFILTAWEAPV